MSFSFVSVDFLQLGTRDCFVGSWMIGVEDYPQYEEHETDDSMGVVYRRPSPLWLAKLQLGHLNKAIFHKQY